MKRHLPLLALIISCTTILSYGQYTGTGSVTQGLATTTTSNLYNCGRTSGLGTITATDNSTWTVPAEVNYSNSSFPFASDLNNGCDGNNYSTVATALAALDGSDIIDIDAGGELITAYIFADNYFEMYINGTPVGKDPVPYTEFNSCIVRFRVNYPFTIAMLLVDWEENLGVGSEDNGGFAYHAGDGGMVAVFKDSNDNIIATTGSDWKAQTFYTAPIIDLTCPSENGSERVTTACSTQDSQDGSQYYGLHWERPTDWEKDTYDDSSWPDATTYTNTTIGVNNKPAYTNFTSIFDDSNDDAEFIWSTNVILDNEVIVRKTVSSANGIHENGLNNGSLQVYPNPSTDGLFSLKLGNMNAQDVVATQVYNLSGQLIYQTDGFSPALELNDQNAGMYLVQVQTADGVLSRKLILQ